MEQWQKSLGGCLDSLEVLAERFGIDPKPLKPVAERYPMRISPYYLNLIKEAGDPIWRQCVPDPHELEDPFPTDSYNEAELSPVPGLIHRYPDRVVLLVSSSCPTFCRFCMRRSWIRNRSGIDLTESIDQGIEYIKKRNGLRDVILSGGDPLLLSDEALESILIRLRRITHVEIIRIGSRAPVTLPNRVTSRLCRMLRRYHPLYLITHFNHPSEITPLSSKACLRLVDAGIPVGNQSVLLKGVNDDPSIMKELMQKLLIIRVRPYYIHHMDRVEGTSHFWTSVEQGKRIMASLRGHTSGLATPYYVIDLPKGKGKVPILPDDVKRNEKILYLRNYRGEIIEYQDIEERDETE
ncbi:MAG: KamA family radical SAM protein [Thermodesulfobacteriota bacterium]